MTMAPVLDALRREQETAEKMALSLLMEQHELGKLFETQGPSVLKSLEILARQLRDRNAVLDWLNRKQPDLDMQTAMDVIRAGRADVLEHLLSDALRGIPS